MEIYEKNSSVFLKDVTNFDIEQIFTCGQCFRFHKTDENRYEGVAFGKYLSISQVDNLVIIHNCTAYEFHNLWSSFFDLDTDYASISEELCKDVIMDKAISYGRGIRILRQDLFECIVSFIISQNNSIPNIQRVVERISKTYGTFVCNKYGLDHYSFPNPTQLANTTVDELTELKCGYRASYIYEFIQSVVSGKFDMNSIFDMPTDEARKYLMSFKGIGGKVADCILLFCYHKFDVFPTDVWVKKAMKDLYNTDVKEIDDFSMNYFGKNRGLAQQYLFYYKRSNG